MLVSIITPSLNQGHYIKKTLDSITQQTYQNYEHIIIDGESTDHTYKIISTYSNKNKTRVIVEKDNSMYDAINKGLGIARGDIICYINTDDLFLPWTLETVVESFKAGDADMIFGNYITLFDKTKRIHLNYKLPFNKVIYPKYEIINQPTMFFSRECLSVLEGFETKQLHLLSDMDFWMRAINKNIRIKLVNEFLAIDRVHENNLRNSSKYKKELQLLYKKNGFKRSTNQFVRYIFKILAYVHTFINHLMGFILSKRIYGLIKTNKLYFVLLCLIPLKNKRFTKLQYSIQNTTIEY